MSHIYIHHNVILVRPPGARHDRARALRPAVILCHRRPGERRSGGHGGGAYPTPTPTVNNNRREHVHVINIIAFALDENTRIETDN